MTRHYKKARLHVWKYNCVKFGVPMYNSLREKWRTNLPVKKEGKKKERKKERKKLEKKICFTANLTVCLQMQIVQKFAISFKIQLVQYIKGTGNLLPVQVTVSKKK